MKRFLSLLLIALMLLSAIACTPADPIEPSDPTTPDEPSEPETPDEPTRVNVYDQATAANGYWGNDGTYVDDGNFRTSDWIAVKAGDVVSFGAVQDQTCYVVCFDAAKDYLKTLNGDAVSVDVRLNDGSAFLSYTVEEGVSFIRMVCDKNNEQAYLATVNDPFTIDEYNACFGLQMEESETPDEPAAPAEIALVKDGESAFRLVYGRNESQNVKDAAARLVAAIAECTGVTISKTTDRKSYDDTIPEIVLGTNNNREAAQGIVEEMTEDGFSIRAVGNDLVIVASTDIGLEAAVAYFSKAYLSEETSSLVFSKELNDSMSLLDYQTETRHETVTLKKSYSDYIDTYEEKTLVSFNGSEQFVRLLEGGTYDAAHSTDGDGSARWDLKGAHDTIKRFLSCPAGSFSLDASNKNVTTIKLWLYVSDPDMVTCDHDPGYGFQPNQATFYFRAVDGEGREHNWNHTITNAGWHEIELSFNIHNGYFEGFNYADVTGFWIGFSTYGDVTIMVDDIRGVVYETDYVAAEVEGEKNARLISDCESNALDGAIVQEWYGTSYDLEDKVQGGSSLRNVGDGSVNDFRIIVANLDLEMNYLSDVLVFHMKVENLSSVNRIFIELNEVQDKHEYEYNFTIAQLQSYGLSTQSGVWSEVRIPLSSFTKHLDKTKDDTVRLHNFRFVVSAKSGADFDSHIDHIYLASK